MSDDRELKMRCLELAGRMCANNATFDPVTIIQVAGTLYASLPPGPEASGTKKAMARVVDRESRQPQA